MAILFFHSGEQFEYICPALFISKFADIGDYVLHTENYDQEKVKKDILDLYEEFFELLKIDKIRLYEGKDK